MNYTVIDVREPEEYESGHVKGAINVSPSELMNSSIKLKAIPRNAALLLYCRTGSRSNVAKNILKSMGYTNITNGTNKQQVEVTFGL